MSERQNASNIWKPRFSKSHFWGGRQPKSVADLDSLTLSGPLAEIDLPALGAEFEIPIYFVEGENDLTAPPELPKAFLESISAPQKGFYVVPGNGHEPSEADALTSCRRYCWSRSSRWPNSKLQRCLHLNLRVQT